MAKLTKKQKEFANAYLETGNATEAAHKVYDVTTRHSAEVIGSENLRKPEIMAYLDSHVDMARAVIVEIAANSDNKPSDRLAAAKDILDRSLGKAKERIQEESVSEIRITFGQ